MLTANFRRYEYRRRLPHYQRDDRPLFVTFRTSSRFALSPEARRLVLQHCFHDNGKTIHLHAVVIMPDHVHLLLLLLRDENDRPFAMVDILQCLKSTTAHRINRLLRTSGPVWEEESFDHVLRSDESLREKCEYIRQNPVKAGLVARPEDYRWLWIEPELSS